MDTEIIQLNVGGTQYTTTRATLCRYPDSMLGAMFGGCLPSARDNNGCYFIDRDGELFRHVLNFLRNSKLTLQSDFKELTSLSDEADFYQIQPLVDKIGRLQETQTATAPDKQTEYLEITEEIDDMTSPCITISGQKHILKVVFPEYTAEVILAEDNFLDQYVEIATVTLPYHIQTIPIVTRLSLGEALRKCGWKLSNRCMSFTAFEGVGCKIYSDSWKK